MNIFSRIGSRAEGWKMPPSREFRGGRRRNPEHDIQTGRIAAAGPVGYSPQTKLPLAGVNEIAKLPFALPGYPYAVTRLGLTTTPSLTAARGTLRPVLPSADGRASAWDCEV